MKLLIPVLLVLALVLSLYVSLRADIFARLGAYAQGNQQIGTIKFPKEEPKSETINNVWLKECKPAIYLYPKEPLSVHVIVEPIGFLTRTIPQYPLGGWRVTALPSGQIISDNQTFPYLYYESKLLRTKVAKPTVGYVVPTDQLPTLYQVILPQLGLNEQEIRDFSEYWQKALPQAPYYFVGIVNPSVLDSIEPITISPKPDTFIRVRTYFQPLQTMQTVMPPQISTPNRTGFAAVEWGGIVDRSDADFVCSE